MLDPFPLRSPALLQNAISPLTDALSLPTLPLHIHEVLFAFTLYHLINTRVSPWFSTRFFPRTYGALNARTKINWDVHMVSMVQCLLINALALWTIWHDEERAALGVTGRVYGYTGASGLVQAFACGYFLWDFVLCSAHFSVFGAGLLAHAISALLVFSLGFRPFVNYYGPVFILYELSTPFLNLHWFFDKLGMTGSTPQFVNGLFLIGTFFGARLCWGTYNSVHVAYDVYRTVFWKEFQAPPGNGKIDLSPFANVQRHPEEETMHFAAGNAVPTWLCISYLGANVVLNSLNVYWFAKMIETVRKRFDPPFGTKGVSEKERKGKKGDDERYGNGDVHIQRAVDASGRKVLEVEATQVRRRDVVLVEDEVEPQ
jgi:hypothetical protein